MLAKVTELRLSMDKGKPSDKGEKSGDIGSGAAEGDPALWDANVKANRRRKQIDAAKRDMAVVESECLADPHQPALWAKLQALKETLADLEAGEPAKKRLRSNTVRTASHPDALTLRVRGKRECLS